MATRRTAQQQLAAAAAAAAQQRQAQQHQQAVLQAQAHPAPAKGLPAVAPAPGPAKGVVRPAAPATGSTAGAGVPATQPAQFVPDAQYLAEAAQRAFERTTAINSYTQQGQQDQTNTQTAIGRLLERVAGDRSTINQGANKEGLFYSGQLTKRLDDYEKAVQQSKDDLSGGYSQRQDARAAAIAALQQGAPLEEATALEAAKSRQVGRDTSAADIGALALNPAAALLGTSAPAARPQAAASVLDFVKRQRAARAGAAPIKGVRR